MAGLWLALTDPKGEKAMTTKKKQDRGPSRLRQLATRDAWIKRVLAARDVAPQLKEAYRRGYADACKEMAKPGGLG